MRTACEGASVSETEAPPSEGLGWVIEAATPSSTRSRGAALRLRLERAGACSALETVSRTNQEFPPLLAPHKRETTRASPRPFAACGVAATAAWSNSAASASTITAQRKSPTPGGWRSKRHAQAHRDQAQESISSESPADGFIPTRCRVTALRLRRSGKGGRVLCAGNGRWRSKLHAKAHHAQAQEEEPLH
jgi:hypothetical protein